MFLWLFRNYEILNLYSFFSIFQQERKRLQWRWLSRRAGSDSSRQRWRWPCDPSPPQREHINLRCRWRPCFRYSMMRGRFCFRDRHRRLASGNPRGISRVPSRHRYWREHAPIKPLQKVLCHSIGELQALEFLPLYSLSHTLRNHRPR